MSFTFKLIRSILKNQSLTGRNLSTATRITFNRNNIIPLSVYCSSLNNSWMWPRQEPLKLPVNPTNPIILPNGFFTILPLIEPEKDNVTDKIIEDPLSISNDTKQAARLIVIRRKKMKKHKLRKLRKRMKYEWAKIRQRRELKKEKEFQAGLIAQYKQAEAFSAEEYVLDKLKQSKLEPPPPFSKTPEFQELMRIKRLRLYQEYFQRK